MKVKTRVLIGYLFILLGIFMPLLAFTSMSYREIVANKRYAAFREKEESLTDDLKKYNEDVTKGDANIIDPFSNEDYKGYYDIKGIDKEEVFAYLIIPKLDMKKPIYLDATYKHLDLGVAQVEGTSLPLGGKSTRSVIAGHRGWWGDLMFYNVEKLEAGDDIFIDGRSGILKYKVTGADDPDLWEKEYGEVRISKALRRIIDEKICLDNFTFTSDGQGSFPMFNEKNEYIGLGIGKSSCLLEAVKECVFKEDIALEIALRGLTTNPAKILSLNNKGSIKVGFDADINLLDEKTLDIDTVLALGKVMIRDKKVEVLGTFENN